MTWTRVRNEFTVEVSRWRRFVCAPFVVALLTVGLGFTTPTAAQVSLSCTSANGVTFNSAVQVYAGPPFAPGERITITETVAHGFTWRLQIPQAGPIVDGPQPSSVPLVYDVTTSGIQQFAVVSSGITSATIACGLSPIMSSVNPLGSGGLSAVSSAIGFAGSQALYENLEANVRTRFFGGDQFASGGQGIQLASAYRASGLGQRADARSKVALTPEGRLRWSAWIRGTGTWLNDGTAGASYDGTLYSLTGGVDYLITDTFLIGALVGYEDFKLNTTFNNGAFDGKGFSVGPYVGVRFLRHFLFDAVFAYTWLNSDVRGTSATTTASGSFDSTRWLTAANLSGHWRFKKGIRLSPAIGVIYAEETRDAFTNSAGQRTAGGKVRLGRLSFGPEVGVTVYRKGSASIELYVSLKGQYDFKSQGRIVLASGAVIPAAEKLSGRVGFGVNARLNRRATVHIGGFYDGIGRSKFDAWTLEARLRLRW